MANEREAVLEPPATATATAQKAKSRPSSLLRGQSFDLGPDEEPRSPYSNLAFDEYCRSRGARDLVDIFQIRRGEETFADSVRRRFPGHLWARIQQFVGENDPQQDMFRAGPDRRADDLQDETTWSLISLYFRNYTIVATDVHEWYVPVFCAHTTGLTDSKFKASYSAAGKSGFQFNVGIPGLKGGLGTQRSVKFSLQTGEYSVAFQLQAKLSFLISTWRNDRSEVRTVFPVERVGTREVTADDRDHFVDYDRSEKVNVLREPHAVMSKNGSWMKYEVEIGATDKFEIELPDGFGKLAIESEAREAFTVEHYLQPDYEYTWRGIHNKCHDVFVSAVKLR